MFGVRVWIEPQGLRLFLGPITEMTPVKGGFRFPGTGNVFAAPGWHKVALTEECLQKGATSLCLDRVDCHVYYLAPTRAEVEAFWAGVCLGCASEETICYYRYTGTTIYN